MFNPLDSLVNYSACSGDCNACKFNERSINSNTTRVALTSVYKWEANGQYDIGFVNHDLVRCIYLKL